RSSAASTSAQDTGSPFARRFSSASTRSAISCFAASCSPSCFAISSNRRSKRSSALASAPAAPRDDDGAGGGRRRTPARAARGRAAGEGGGGAGRRADAPPPPPGGQPPGPTRAPPVGAPPPRRRVALDVGEQQPAEAEASVEVQREVGGRRVGAPNAHEGCRDR